jgi:light-harvesting protein B-800-850 alpha chain
MNQGRIWCVVNPTVGLPLFLGSVAITSLVVHFAVLSHTGWFSNYWMGSTRPKTAMNGDAAAVASIVPQSSPAFTVSVAPVAATPGVVQTSFVVTVTPNNVTTAQAEPGAKSHPDEKLALAKTQ